MSDLPFISIIIPVYNDAKGILDTLYALSFQDYPEKFFEVIVVDNASTDNTAVKIAQFILQYKNFSLLHEEIQSSYAARNRGIEFAKGDYLLFVDADMTMESDWLLKISKFILNTKAVYFGTKVKITSESFSIFDIDSLITGFPVQFYIDNMHFAPTCCLCISKTIIDTVGKFDSRLVSGGDQEYGSRVYFSNFPQHYASDIVIFHPSRTTLRAVWKKSERIGRGFYQLAYYYPERFEKKHRSIYNPRYFFPPNPQKYIDLAKKELSRKNIWNQLHRSRQLAIFCLWWIREIAVHIGYCREWIRHQT